MPALVSCADALDVGRIGIGQTRNPPHRAHILHSFPSLPCGDRCDVGALSVRLFVLYLEGGGGGLLMVVWRCYFCVD